jgi:tetratricopeptide (TPR) repeat protein
VTGLRALWDFGDLDATERRFEERLGEERDAVARAEILTQLARVHSLRGEFGRCATLLDEAEALAGADTVVRPWIEIERGRMHNSAGEVEAAQALFEDSYEGALAASRFFLAGDAAHMAAIAAPDLSGKEEWTRRGLELGEREPDAAYWAGPLLNNLGWAYADAADHERALELFEQALGARRRDPDNTAGIAWGEYAVGYTLRRLGREDDARPLLQSAASTLPDEPEIAAELGAPTA